MLGRGGVGDLLLLLLWPVGQCGGDLTGGTGAGLLCSLRSQHHQRDGAAYPKLFHFDSPCRAKGRRGKHQTISCRPLFPLDARTPRFVVGARRRAA